MEERYNPEQVETSVQRFWAEQGTFEVTEDPEREKFYCLCMFPYPSGRLHMGHVRNYTIGDVVGRYHRMRGFNVLQPMGWDAFGLPAENAAIQNKVPPARWTYQNIAYMREQLKRLGFGYDWTRELATCKPDYYRWEQWMFTRLYKKGLAYRRMAEVNWDPVDQTVLANEQVIDGRGWRSGAIVERRQIPQWFMKITEYADELLAELDNLDWPDAVKTMQRNWIGRSEGLEVDFPLVDREEGALRIYTTRPDTIYGATFMAVAADHPLACSVSETNAEVARFCEECRQGGTSEAELETMEKRGMLLGVEAVNPLTGRNIPVWVANFVLMGYGTGAIMAVPAHDERDHEFARKYDMPIVQVIAPAEGELEADIQEQAWTAKEEVVTVNSGEFSGLSFQAAFDAIANWCEAREIGTRQTNYRLRDWGVSRQRYWGCPVPIVHCDTCGEVAVPDDQLPVVLPEDVDVQGGASPLAKLDDFVATTCPECGGPARRDTDTFDTFMESSWYFARFATPGQDEAKLDARADYWMPVDLYIGGIEHAILHLLYARFYQKMMRDEGVVRDGEPFSSLMTQGMVLNETFYRDGASGSQTFYSPTEVEVARDSKGKPTGANLKADGKPVFVGGVEKMSKSKNNGIDPENMVQRFGADTVRLYMMFTSPPDHTLEWSDSAVEGAFRFLRRLWGLVYAHVQGGPAGPVDASDLGVSQKELRRKVHETIVKVSDDIGRRYTFNTAIAAVMELFNTMTRFEDDSAQGRALMDEALENVVLLLAPIVPHVAHAMWEGLGRTESLVDYPWPQADEAALVRDTIDLVVQVNGKVRGRISVAADASKETVESEAQGNENVLRFTDGKAIRKVIVVPGKLVNIVV